MSEEYSNLPPGTCDGDPRAPWNERVDESGTTCGTCNFLCTIWPEDGHGRAIGYACARDAAYGDLFECEPGYEPCGFWDGDR